MEITFTTPALLFPAISLLILAYTNKFLAIASLIRNLHSQYEAKHLEMIQTQILNLKRRVYLIMMMQAFAILSFFELFPVHVHVVLWQYENGHDGIRGQSDSHDYFPCNLPLGNYNFCGCTQGSTR